MAVHSIVGRITVADWPEEKVPGATPTMCCGVKELSGLSWLGQEVTVQTDVYGNPVTREHITPAKYLGGLIYKLWGRDPLAKHPDPYIPQFDPSISKLISCAHVMYNQAIRQGISRNPYGEEFTAYILENRLGEVTRIKPTINPNSNNVLTTFIWTVDHNAVLAWWEKHRLEA